MQSLTTLIEQLCPLNELSAAQPRTCELESRTLLLAEQRAREEIAKTLHDGLQQLLVVVALDLDQVLKQDADPAASRELLAEAKQTVDDAIAAVRSLTLELSPPVLHRSGLPAALAWLARSTHDKYRMDLRVDADPDADSPRKEVRTLLFESVRELVFNAVKHAGAGRITVTSALDPGDELCITVSDDGVGFDPAALDDGASSGRGLFSIRERLELLGGRIDVRSAPGRGTCVRLVVPRDGDRREARHQPQSCDRALEFSSRTIIRAS